VGPHWDFLVGFLQIFLQSILSGYFNVGLSPAQAGGSVGRRWRRTQGRRRQGGGDRISKGDAFWLA